jgi:hypothetical protein
VKEKLELEVKDEDSGLRIAFSFTIEKRSQELPLIAGKKLSYLFNSVMEVGTCFEVKIKCFSMMELIFLTTKLFVQRITAE